MRRSLSLRLLAIAAAAACTIVAFFLVSSLDVFERFSAFAERNEAWELDDAAVVVVLAALLGALFLAISRGRALSAAQAKLAEAEPAPVVCSVCGRDEIGNARLSASATSASDDSAAFTHTVCADCLALLERSPMADIAAEASL